MLKTSFLPTNFLGFNRTQEPLIPIQSILLPVMHIKSGIGGVILHWITATPKKQKRIKVELKNETKKKKLRKQKPVLYEESSAEESTNSSDSDYEEENNLKKKAQIIQPPYGQANRKALEFLKQKFGDSFTAISPQGKQINQLIEDNGAFCEHLQPNQRDVWMAFSQVVSGFLGKTRACNYKELIGNLMKHMKANAIKCTPKVHLLGKHLDKFPESNSDFSEEAGEAYHHTVYERLENFKIPESKMINFLADMYWRLERDTVEEIPKRKFNNASHF